LTPLPDHNHITRRDEERLLQVLEKALAKDFPNPERRGCPGADVLRAIAARKLSLAEVEPWIDHLGSCTPCFQDYKESRRRVRARRRLATLATAAIIICVVALSVWIIVRLRQGRPVESTAVILDLRDRLMLRGVPGGGENGQASLTLFVGVDNVSLYLPPGSRTGAYEVGVFDVPGVSLTSAKGTADLEGGLVVLKARLSLSTVNIGQHLLGIRLPGVEWSYYPVVVR
jgi:hypothetical protein